MTRIRKTASSEFPAANEEYNSFSNPDGEQARSVTDHQRKVRNILKGILKQEVIPRVFDTNVTPTGLPKEIANKLSDDDIGEFQSLILDDDHAACMEYVQSRIDNGMPLRALCLGLFTASARELGERWQRDELSFAEVTLGLGTLHILVHQFSARDRSIAAAGERHNIILAGAPKEQHAFGVLIVSKIFEMEGWLVTGGPDMHTGADLTSIVRKSWFDIIGLTASNEENAHELEEEIVKLRKASLNPSVCVMVGGNGFANHPEIFRTIGADELASDADDAIRKARAFLLETERLAEG